MRKLVNVAVGSGADARVSPDLGRFAPKPDSRLLARGRDPAGLFLMLWTAPPPASRAIELGAHAKGA